LAEADQLLVEADILTGDRGIGQTLWRPWIRYQRALVAMDADRYELSREMGLCALEGFTTLRHRYGSAHCRLLIGQSYLLESMVDKATPVLEEAHSTLRQCGDRWLEADAAVALARAYQLAERSHEAVDLLSAAEQAFAKLGDHQALIRVGNHLREVESAFPAHRTARRIHGVARGHRRPAGSIRWPSGPSISAVDDEGAVGNGASLGSR
jgi:tetratricopeptide (TPR) repeat protein